MLAREESIGNPAYWVGGVRHRDGAILILAFMRNCGNLLHFAKGEGQEKKIEAKSTDKCGRGGSTRSSGDLFVTNSERRGWIISQRLRQQPSLGGFL